ncbi:hypothetical protein K435DRAFT_795184 [Dendrothele bispora CBS 962.96]|uniref:Uncharacterized protein n=1 Tax=Dendrothele bispora (strain CBS 962.96) TaxID=1314807 RepID=A0A4S8M9U0_DENBC|nr:hypothetical protein K435DRAFT_795184 [Dendrothele bispora CBS 962.96]
MQIIHAVTCIHEAAGHQRFLKYRTHICAYNKSNDSGNYNALEVFPSFLRFQPAFLFILTHLYVQTFVSESTLQLRLIRGPSDDDGKEVALMEALADAEEDAIPDDGAIEIDSEEEYQG